MRKIKTLLITVGCREEEPAEIACGTNRYHTDKKEIFLEDLVWAKNNPNLLANCATDEERIALSALRGSFVSAIEYNKFSEIDSILIPTVQEPRNNASYDTFS